MNLKEYRVPMFITTLLTGISITFITKQQHLYTIFFSILIIHLIIYSVYEATK